MSKKILRCYQGVLKEDSTRCNIATIKKVLMHIFGDNSTTLKLENGNKYFEYTDEENCKFTLERIEKINDNCVDENFLFLRLGKPKDIKDMLKRNRTTLLGQGVLSQDEQKLYELEVCTYFLVDIRNCIIIEMFGQYAPGIKMLSILIKDRINKDKLLSSEKFDFGYNNIMTDQMIESFRMNADKLRRIGYNYAIPNIRVLRNLGLSVEQINSLEDIGFLQLSLVVHSTPNIPISKNRDTINAIIQAFKNCKNEIKNKLFFEGNIKNGNCQRYTFDKTAVTYIINVDYDKKEDGVVTSLELYEIEDQVYNKIINQYRAEKENINRYISEN